MRIISDLHIHGRFSRATSKELTIKNLSYWGAKKGLSLIGTGDFTHPEWLKELKRDLKDDGTGILKSADGMAFVLQTEVSNIYTQDGKGRKVHNIILAPSFGVVKQVNDWLLTKGRLDYDGRPIFSFSCPELVESLMSISRDIEVIPAHAWTPWFSVFGSRSGFDSMKECYQDQARHIHALETGLSSDPAMNWRVSALDKYTLVSNSDSHSFWPWRMGREANVMELKKLTYKALLDVIRTRKGMVETLEFFPEEGKYHWDGHRACDVCMEPSEAMKIKGVCPVCRQPLTIGVAHRVEELADRPPGYMLKGAPSFRSVIPLSELIAGALGVATVTSSKVWGAYNSLIKRFGNEFDVLFEAPEPELVKVVGERVAGIIIKARRQEIKVEPGYDGVYGHPVFDNSHPKIKQIKKKQASLKDF